MVVRLCALWRWRGGVWTVELQVQLAFGKKALFIHRYTRLFGSAPRHGPGAWGLAGQRTAAAAYSRHPDSQPPI